MNGVGATYVRRTPDGRPGARVALSGGRGPAAHKLPQPKGAKRPHVSTDLSPNLGLCISMGLPHATDAMTEEQGLLTMRRSWSADVPIPRSALVPAVVTKQGTLSTGVRLSG